MDCSPNNCCLIASPFGIPTNLVPFDLLFLSDVGIDWEDSCVDLDSICLKKRDVTRLQVGEKDDAAQHGGGGLALSRS